MSGYATKKAWAYIILNRASKDNAPTHMGAWTIHAQPLLTLLELCSYPWIEPLSLVKHSYGDLSTNWSLSHWQQSGFLNFHPQCQGCAQEHYWWHLEVISSSLISPNPNVRFSILTCSTVVIEREWIRGSWDWRDRVGMVILMGANSMLI